MSHLTPRRTVRITPGGSASITPAAGGEPVEPDTSWKGLTADLARAIGLDQQVTIDFTQKIDAVVEAIAAAGDEPIDLEVARTRVRAALLGNTAMLTEHVPVDLSDARADELLATWEPASPDATVESDRLLARLALMHHDLVAPAIPPGHDDTVGEGDGGSAEPLPETDVHVGQVAYTLDAVPDTAKGVIAWLKEAGTDDDRRARAQAARDVEQAREAGVRSSVVEAIVGVLDG